MFPNTRCGSVAAAWRSCPALASPTSSAPTNRTRRIWRLTCGEMPSELPRCGWTSLKATCTWPGIFPWRWALLNLLVSTSGLNLMYYSILCILSVVLICVQSSTESSKVSWCRAFLFKQNQWIRFLRNAKNCENRASSNYSLVVWSRWRSSVSNQQLFCIHCCFTPRLSLWYSTLTWWF